MRDGYWHRSKLLARLCGTRSYLPPIVSTGSRMLITYRTADNSVPQTGFVAGYEGWHRVMNTRAILIIDRYEDVIPIR